MPAFEPLKHGAVDVGTGAAATSFGVSEHRSTYSYDPLTGTYGKVEDGETMTDASLRRGLGCRIESLPSVWS